MKLWETLGLGERSVNCRCGCGCVGSRYALSSLSGVGRGPAFAFEPDENRHEELRSHLDGDVVSPALRSRGRIPANPLHCTGRDDVDPGAGPGELRFPDAVRHAAILPFETFVRPVAVPTRRLDDVSEIPSIDFLKIDIQGGELVVLNNGWEKLRECAVIQIEVSFLSLYKGQPSSRTSTASFDGTASWCTAWPK